MGRILSPPASTLGARQIRTISSDLCPNFSTSALCAHTFPPPSPLRPFHGDMVWQAASPQMGLDMGSWTEPCKSWTSVRNKPGITQSHPSRDPLASVQDEYVSTYQARVMYRYTSHCIRPLLLCFRLIVWPRTCGIVGPCVDPRDGEEGARMEFVWFVRNI